MNKNQIRTIFQTTDNETHETEIAAIRHQSRIDLQEFIQAYIPEGKTELDVHDFISAIVDNRSYVHINPALAFTNLIIMSK